MSQPGEYCENCGTGERSQRIVISPGGTSADMVTPRLCAACRQKQYPWMPEGGVLDREDFRPGGGWFVSLRPYAGDNADSGKVGDGGVAFSASGPVAPSPILPSKSEEIVYLPRGTKVYPGFAKQSAFAKNGWNAVSLYARQTCIGTSVLRTFNVLPSSRIDELMFFPNAAASPSTYVLTVFAQVDRDPDDDGGEMLTADDGYLEDDDDEDDYPYEGDGDGDGDGEDEDDSWA